MRRFGIPPATAQEQGQKNHDAISSSQPFEPLPAPTGQPPFRLALGTVIPEKAGAVFHVIGDSGGIKDPNPQAAVAAALAADKASHGNGVDFAYSVGDVVYFNGAKSEYPPQFYEAYAHYNVPIFAIPGNHDGDPEEDGEASLQAFMRYFCDSTPQLLPEVAEYQRDTMTQPNPYWTLTGPAATIVGLYTNVPEGGKVEPDQIAWLVEELKAAPAGVALIVALHHPPYSGDAHHGGSERMGKVLDEAFAQAGRTPDLILSGHVHNYQRFSRTTADGLVVPYIVAGASGYHNLHAMASGAAVGEHLTEDCTLEAFHDNEWGFLRLSVNAGAIAGEYVGVGKDGTVTPGVDSFQVPVRAAAA